jgi:hypothetical protein
MRLVKSLSWRTRSISAARASSTRAFNLILRFRATAPAVSPALPTSQPVTWRTSHENEATPVESALATLGP